RSRAWPRASRLPSAKKARPDVGGPFAVHTGNAAIPLQSIPMGAPIRLVVGLGNSGREHAASRHNAGCWFADALASRLGATFIRETKFQGQVARTADGLRLLKPGTYMNLSGRSVASLSRFFALPAEGVLVAHDELDLQ